MLSNKLTFSLVYLVFFGAILALIATPAVAQDVTVLDGETDDIIDIAAGEFLVVQVAAVADPRTNGILSNITPIQDSELPDLNDFFARGGTIEVLAPMTVSRFEQSDPRWHDVVVTEIMWGLDEGVAQPVSDKQWIELYNNTGPVPAYKDNDGRGTAREEEAMNDLRLMFTTNIYFGSKADKSPGETRRYVGTSGTPTVYTVLDDRPVYTNDLNNDGNVGDPGFIMTASTEAGTAHTAYTTVYKVVDRVGNMGRGGRKGPMPGQSGRVQGNTGPDNNPSVSLISAFRKRVLLLDDETGVGTYHPAHAFGVGTDLGQWMASWEEGNAVRRVNLEEPYIGTPGQEHLTPKPPDATVVGVGLVFNEIRNDLSEDDIDWIELYNNSDDAVALEGYEITRVVDGADPTKGADSDTDLISLPAKDDDGEKIMLGAGEYLLIVNQEPEDSILADGKDITINASNRLKLEGATHLYYHPDTAWTLDDKKVLLILRGKADKNGTPDEIADVAGQLYITDLRDDLDTKVWPLRNWAAPKADDDADVGNFGSQGRDSMTWARVKYEADKWFHKDHWVQHDYMGGIGYRKDLDHGIHEVAPGTPGYRNGTKGTLADFTKADAGGAVTISEIMYDAGAAWDLVQWVELYNNSMTESVDISDWTMDIRNARDAEEPDRSFVDADFEFDAGTIIAPNQTLLVVSATGATNVPANRVYDLYERHGNELGLKSRRAYLLSKVGFRVELYDDAVTPVLVDNAGNAYLDGASVITGEANPDDANDGGWALHEVSGEGEARHSMVRQYGGRYGTRDETAGYESAAPGTMDGAWRKAGLESGNIGIFYGHTDDFSTPAFRRGGPLPVSLASFRPYRDKATGEVVVRWVTESELNNAGFNILRSEAKTGQFKVINLKGLIQGQGTTSEKHVYSFIDKTAKPNVVYYYQIEDVSMDGQRTTLTTTHLRGNVTAANKLTTRWGELKSSD